METTGLVVPAGAPEKVLKRLDELLAAAEGAVAAALYQEGLAVDALAVKLTPVDTGRLRATHYVAPPVKDGSRVTVEAGFGTDYAVYVHENTGARHVTGQAKFLESAVNQRSSGFAERLARRASKLWREGVTVTPLDPAVPTSPQDVGPIGKQLGPTRADKVRGERAARRERVRTARKVRKAFKRAIARMKRNW